jgi:ribosome maturation factor RimP
LFELNHYQEQIGKRIKIRVRIPSEDRRQWAGILQRVEGENIYLLVDKNEMMVPFSNIEKGNVIAEW